MRTLFTSSFLLVTLSLFSQSPKPTSFVLRYQNVTEYVFNEKVQYYVPTDTFDFSGAISIDPAKVFIKSYNQEQDRKLNIIEIQKEPGTDREMYLCEMHGERYAVAISPDRRYLTQIGVNDKCIYELTLNKSKSQQFEIIDIKKDQNSEAIFTIVEKMPLFNGSSNQEQSTGLVFKYLNQKVKEDIFNAKGIVFISFIVNQKGETENIKVLRGINYECDKKSIKYIENMPIWTPGEQRGEKVKVQFTIPIKIK